VAVALAISLDRRWDNVRRRSAIACVYH